jgi:hypothetical protein
MHGIALGTFYRLDTFRYTLEYNEFISILPRLGRQKTGN